MVTRFIRGYRIPQFTESEWSVTLEFQEVKLAWGDVIPDAPFDLGGSAGITGCGWRKIDQRSGPASVLFANHPFARNLSETHPWAGLNTRCDLRQNRPLTVPPADKSSH